MGGGLDSRCVGRVYGTCVCSTCVYGTLKIHIIFENKIFKCENKIKDSVRMAMQCLFISTIVQSTVAQLVEALHYKPEGRGFDSRLCHWNFSLT
jgi:hypothetical protein